MAIALSIYGTLFLKFAKKLAKTLLNFISKELAKNLCMFYWSFYF
jgi:hypothetical protein